MNSTNPKRPHEHIKDNGSCSRDFKVTVTEEFSSYSASLLENQNIAIRHGSIYSVEKTTRVDAMGWTTGFPSLSCMHINLKPTKKEKLDLLLGHPVTLVEKGGLVVGGVFLVSAKNCLKLQNDPVTDLSLLADKYATFLQSISNDCITHRPMQSGLAYVDTIYKTSTIARSNTKSLRAVSHQSVSKNYLGVPLATTEFANARHEQPQNQKIQYHPPTLPTLNIVSPSTSSVPSVKVTDVELNHEGFCRSKKGSTISPRPLAPSASKKELFARLDLNEDTHRILLVRVSNLIQQSFFFNTELLSQLQAHTVRDSISQDPRSLSLRLSRDPSVDIPYRWDKISEKAKHEAYMALVTGAFKIIAPYYSRGRYFTNVSEENWVARWYFWHSFRYRLVHTLDKDIKIG